MHFMASRDSTHHAFIKSMRSSPRLAIGWLLRCCCWFAASKACKLVFLPRVFLLAIVFATLGDCKFADCEIGRFGSCAISSVGTDLVGIFFGTLRGLADCNVAMVLHDEHCNLNVLTSGLEPGFRFAVDRLARFSSCVIVLQDHPGIRRLPQAVQTLSPASGIATPCSSAT